MSGAPLSASAGRRGSPSALEGELEGAQRTPRVLRALVLPPRLRADLRELELCGGHANVLRTPCALADPDRTHEQPLRLAPVSQRPHQGRLAHQGKGYVRIVPTQSALANLEGTLRRLARRGVIGAGRELGREQIEAPRDLEVIRSERALADLESALGGGHRFRRSTLVPERLDETVEHGRHLDRPRARRALLAREELACLRLRLLESPAREQPIGGAQSLVELGPERGSIGLLGCHDVRGARRAIPGHRHGTRVGHNRQRGGDAHKSDRDGAGPCGGRAERSRQDHSRTISG